MTTTVAGTHSGPSCLGGIWGRLGGFWGREELQVLALNLAVHTLVQLAALKFMPLPYYSELSLHDGNAYYRMSQDLLPAVPLFRLHWHKRILLPLLVAISFPSTRHWGFLVIGVLGASLSAVYFYKIAERYTEYPCAVAVLYSFLPYLFFPAHHGLAEPLMMLLLLAGYHYFVESHDLKSIVCWSLAVLAKEVAVIPVATLAVATVLLEQKQMRRAVTMGVTLLPAVAFALFMGWRWGNLTWYVQGAHMSLVPGLWRMVEALVSPPASSASRTVSMWYNLLNQALSAGVLVFTAVGTYRLRAKDRVLALSCGLTLIPLWFMSQNLEANPHENLYALNVNLGRQFLIAWPSMLGLAGLLPRLRGRRVVVVSALVMCMLMLSGLWIVMYAKFFVFHKVI